MSLLPIALRNRKSAIIKGSLLTACAALFTVLIPAALPAQPITYNLTLTPQAGFTVGGTGTFTIEGTPASNGISDHTLAHNLDNLSLAGQAFTSPGDGTPLVEFLNGSLRDITFSQELAADPSHRFRLHTSDRYVFAYNNEQSQSIGTFTATQAHAFSRVPEPASLLLLTTGLFSGAVLLHRRMEVQAIG